MRKHGMSKQEVDIATNTRQHLSRSYWTTICGGQVPVVTTASDVVVATPGTTTSTTVSTAQTTAPPADTPSGDAL